jgi:dihydropyrimidinase
MHIDFVLPVAHDLLAGWAEWQRKAEAAVMDYGFHMAVTSWSKQVAADMQVIVSRGVNSFKFFMAYKGGLQGSQGVGLHAQGWVGVQSAWICVALKHAI